MVHPLPHRNAGADALQKEMGADGKFEVAAINIDTGNDDKPNAFRKDTGITSLAFYRDNTLGTFNRLKKEGLAFGLPATMLIDKNGCLVAAMNGPAAWHSEDAKALVVRRRGIEGRRLARQRSSCSVMPDLIRHPVARVCGGETYLSQCRSESGISCANETRPSDAAS